MGKNGLLTFLLLSILLLYLTCEAEAKRGGGGSRGGGSRGGGSRGGSSSSNSVGSSNYGAKTYEGKAYAGGYGTTWGSSAMPWSTTSGLSKFGDNNRWGYSGGHRIYYVGYHPYIYYGYSYHHHHNGSPYGHDDDFDYEWKPMSPWTIMLLVWLGLFSVGFLAWLAVYCMYKE